MNRLASETSPYLRQHADNPVDWYPWGDDAFETARREAKPILVSVGYSACHWCHVMAHESFEDADTAALMNDWFVNVKVDREERPDVDAVYMEAVQAMTGRGGWPMTVFCAPDGRPFFGGTYFPATARPGTPSFRQLLESVHDAWTNRRDELDDQIERLGTAIGRMALVEPDPDLPPPGTLTTAVHELRRVHDAAWGGFGGAPKFPQAMALDAVLRHHVRTGDLDDVLLATTSLDAMASGGMYDHLRGGFARYSTDDRWIVPHFEKMLYDNALLARVYLHAWQVTGKERHLQVCSETIDYVLGDLTTPGGGFCSAEDADSEGEEGRYYLWSLDEVREVLGHDAELAIDWYGMTEQGNFEGRNIPVRPVRGDLVRPPEVEELRRRLLAHRDQRVRPGLDDKVLTEWNGLMLATLAEAAAATGNGSWLTAALADGEFLVEHLRRDDGRWMRSWQTDAGEARHLAYAADHGALVDAFTRLAEASGQGRWIDLAVETADALLDLFWDDERGGVFTTGHDAPPLVTRPKDLMDNALPSANSLAAVGLLRLAALTGSQRYRDRALDVLRLVGSLAGTHPTAFGHALAAIDLVESGIDEIVIVGDEPDLVRTVHQRWMPGAVLAWGEPYDSPLWHGRRPGHAYVCRGFTCELPVTSSGDLSAQLDAR